MEIFIKALIFVTGLINFIPLSGAFGKEKLEQLYGIPITDKNLLILMRHRAVLFGIIGGFMIYAAFQTHLQLSAIVIGYLSMLSFMVLCYTEKEYSVHLRKVFVADVLGLIFLGIATVLKFL